jgi:transposase
MGFVDYPPPVKAICVQMLMSGKSPTTINKTIGYKILLRSFARWKALYRNTQSVVRDPATYERRGRPLLLKRSEADFVLDLLKADPTLYLDEIQSKIVNESGVVLSRSTVYDLLVKRLGQTLKVARTVHPSQCPMKRAAYTIEVSAYPAEYLVFVGQYCSSQYIMACF